MKSFSWDVLNLDSPTVRIVRLEAITTVAHVQIACHANRRLVQKKADLSYALNGRLIKNLSKTKHMHHSALMHNEIGTCTLFGTCHSIRPKL